MLAVRLARQSQQPVPQRRLLHWSGSRLWPRCDSNDQPLLAFSAYLDTVLGCLTISSRYFYPTRIQRDRCVLLDTDVERVDPSQTILTVLIKQRCLGLSATEFLTASLHPIRILQCLFAEPTSPMRHRLELLGVPRSHHIRVQLDEVLRRRSRALRVVALYCLGSLRLGRHRWRRARGRGSQRRTSWGLSRFRWRAGTCRQR